MCTYNESTSLYTVYFEGNTNQVTQKALYDKYIHMMMSFVIMGATI